MGAENSDRRRNAPAPPPDAGAPSDGETRYRYLFEESLAANAIISPDFQILDLNRAFVESMGYTKEQIIGRSAMDFIEPADWPKARESIARALRAEPVAESIEVRLLGKHAVRTLVFAGGLAKIHRAGELIGVMVNGIDITERKRAEDELLRSEAWYRSLMDHGGSVYAVLDVQGSVVYESDSLERVYGWKPEEIVGKSVFEHVHPDDQARSRRRFQELLARPGVLMTAELRYRHKNGSWRTICASGINLLGDPAVQGIVLSSHDITDQRAAEEALRAARRKLTTAEEDERRRLARELHDSLGQELVALKMAIQGEAAERRTSGDARLAAALAGMVDRCSEMVRDVRAICHGLYPPALESLGLAAALRQLARTSEGTMAVGVAVSGLAADARFGPHVEIALYRIAQEALSNALRHSAGGRISLGLRHADGSLSLTVVDDGAGFDVEKAASRGLGLSTMRERARTVGGKLTVTSHPGRTEVRVEVPVGPRQQAVQEEESRGR